MRVVRPASRIQMQKMPWLVLLRYALVALSSLRHFKVAWEGVLHLIHRELKILEESPTFMGSERERQEFKKRRKQIATVVLETSTGAAQTWVVQGNFTLAVAGALYAARTAEMLFGTDSLEVVHPQLLLAQIYLGLNQLHSAEELLNMVYCAACEFGPTSFRMVPAFFSMAEVFRKCGHPDSHTACKAMYTKVCDIIIRWFEQNADMTPNAEGTASPKSTASGENCKEGFAKSRLEMQEATETVRQIIEHSKSSPTESSELQSMALCAMGLIHAQTDDLELAKTYIQQAKQLCNAETGRNCRLYKKCEMFENVISSMQMKALKDDNQKSE
ncbi:hypothetical protein, conserved [Eimeria maxima]|uniref:Uncharacterized protein n=1 Tax=Eimeria maxima TaxID=5804 RepID=U6MBK5_EIMMA|nr:hypothetical protein, conserved [Eimeria maxima]CDJ60443.1 hypothetical protein, conserved [Eimeria maxima]